MLHAHTVIVNLRPIDIPSGKGQVELHLGAG